MTHAARLSTPRALTDASGWIEPKPTALLVLADGTVIEGQAIGALGEAEGEVCFNTAMTGYEEILTDPSYARQIVTLTYPHIGNTGANAEDVESTRVHAAGLVIRNLPLQSSNFRENWNLSEYLKRENIVAIADIDTRKLTRILRDQRQLDLIHTALITARADQLRDRSHFMLQSPFR